MALTIPGNCFIKKKTSCYLLLSCLSVAGVITTSGSTVTWTSPVMNILESNDPNVNPLKKPITPEQTSLIAGLIWLGSIFGTIIFVLVVDRIGRKNTIIFTSILNILAFITLAFANNINLYYVARFAMGISTGALIPSSAIFVIEIAEVHNRGFFTGFVFTFGPFGSVYAYIIGVCFKIRLFTLLCALPSLIGLIVLVVYAPESPIHLLAKGDRAAATNILKKLRNRDEVADDLAEIDAMMKKIKENKSVSFLEVLSDRATKKALVIATGVALIMGFSGDIAISAFLGPTLDSVGMNVSGNAIAIIVGLVKYACSCLSSVVVEKIGRRPLVLMSTIFTSLSLITLGFYFQFKNTMQYFWWLPVLCIVIFIITYSIGIGSVFFVIAGEIVPNHIRAKAVSFVTLIKIVCVSITTFVFPLMKQHFGIPACFFSFGCCCFLGVVFTYFMLPETKGKTFTDIQSMLTGSKHICKS